MRREPHQQTGRRTIGRPICIAALPALALAVSAQAQVPGSVQDYRLPPASPSPTPSAAGPVDSDHPVAAPTTPTATPSPVIALPSPAAASPAVEPRPATTPRAAPSSLAAPSPAPSASPAAMAPALPLPVVPTTAATEPAAVAAYAAPPQAAPARDSARWPWVAGGAVLLGLLGALLLRFRRRRAPDDEATDYEPELAEPAEPPPSPTPPSPPPAPPAKPRPLDMQLEARHLSRAMVNATLAYRLVLTNRAPTATGPLRIAGDIVSAHASLSAAEQLAPGEAALAALHEVPSLAPGETVALSGELRLPIASILPIGSAGSRVFVPLARFRAEPQGGAVTTRVFVVGQASDRPGGALRPFPLDRGPGVDRGLGQHELEMPA